MASGAKMSFSHYQNGKFGSFPHAPQKDFEITQDLHLKMSKKIAQLTKVIYALNTKNDEHDMVLQTLRDQHEEEIQQILSDAKQKVAHLKERCDEEANHRTTIETLQAKIAEYEAQISSHEDQFLTYKSEMQKHIEIEQENYLMKLNQMSQEMTKTKDNFEEHLSNFKSWKERVAAEHAVELADLKRKHQSELADLQGIKKDQDDTWLSQRAKIMEEFKKETENLKSQIKLLEVDKIRLSEDYTAKLEKATAFYEKELEVLRNSKTQESTREINQMRKEMDELKTDYKSSEKELKTQIERLVHQLANTEDELKQSQHECQLLEEELAGRASKSSELSVQLGEVKEELTRVVSSLKKAETELAASKQHCSDLADELVKKSSKLGELEAYNSQKDCIITSQHTDIEKLTAQIRKLNIEKNSVITEQQSITSEQRNTLENLQKALENVSLEKETLQVRLEKQIQTFQQQLQKIRQEHVDELTKKLEEAEHRHAEAIDKERKAAADVLLSVKQEQNQLHKSEMNQITIERDSLQQELKYLKEDFNNKLADAKNEVARLDKLVKESQEGLGSASGQLASLREAASQLRTELDKARAELRVSNAELENLKAQCDRQKVEHDEEVAQLKQKLNDELQSLSRKLDQKWTEAMKSENGKLRQELAEQHESEKRAALSQLSRLKNEEMVATRADLEAKLECLKGQVEELQSKLDDAKLEGDVEKAKLKYELERERSRLSKDMLEATQEYSSKISAMEKMHASEREQLRAQMEQEKDALEAKLKKLHMEELQSQITAHRAVLDNTIKLEQRQKQEELDRLKSRHQEESENLQAQLEQKHKADVDALKLAHLAEIRVARMELERAVEISKQKERDQMMQLEELQGEIGNREGHINSLQDQAKELQEQINKLKIEIEAKVLEVKQAHKQASQQLKIQEDKLTRQNQATVDNLTADHLREQQDMLAQFRSAQDLLKEKIYVLQNELEAAQERYARRESRPEDLELIDTLRCDVSERETRIKDLIEEKKFYQLELVNRETNFNKVFNATPNVGILNPFQKPKKKGDKPGKTSAGPSLTIGSGSGSGHQKLDPLPGSPLHDGLLNPTKPLPQPGHTKKMVK